MSVSIVTSSGVTLSSAQSTTASDDPTSTGLSLSDYVSSDTRMTIYDNQIDQIATKITSESAKLTAYRNMQSLLLSLESAAEKLAGMDGQSSTEDVFAERSSSLTSSSSTSADNILSVAVDAGTATGTHTVVVQQLATAEQVASGDQTSSTSALGYSGSFVIGAGSSAATISITASMALTDIVTMINNSSSNSGVTASVVKVSDGDYVLEVTATDTGEDITMTDLSGGVLTGLGLIDSSGNAADVITEAQSAILTVDGITGITRISNTIDDVLTGITFDLAGADASTTVSIKITPNTEDVATAIDDLVTAYNNWQSFYATEQSTNTDGTASTSAVLFGDSTLRDVNNAISNALSSLVNKMSLGAIGISFTESNTLTVDSASLTAMLTDSYSSVASLFEYQASSDSANLALSSDRSADYSGTLSFLISTSTSGTISSATVTDSTSGSTVDFTVSGTSLTGSSTGAASGLTFTYSGSTTSSAIKVSVTQGIADILYQLAQDYGDSTGSVLSDKISDLTDEITDLQTQESEVETQMSSYYDELLTRYAAAVAKISALNSTYDLLKELISSDNSSS